MKKATTVYLEHEQLERLKRFSERTKIPMAAIIREGVDMALEKRIQPEEKNL